MEIHDIEEPGTFAFEIDSRIGQRGAVKALMSIPGVRIIRRPTGPVWYFENVFWTAREDRFCEFEFEGEQFQVFEPWGDSNRFWIGPIDEKKRSPHIRRIREHFASLNI